ncbi:hypothetical protein [Lentiprolixibacter aurantiacus]|uniref:Uncharacterized protein n=1 Tax=Lentiprolixibacter aurantiacus TaxID=2993939 RepID=A0AAE3MJJ6_9FLAO|nr:hypothetical protein [Lentiprolixibacter aurantiacus]MCX2718603.1 hypothetical protein [Lentiprolixibacter aurantiacus]
MEEHNKLSDEEFKRQFANCTLPSEVFSHEAHLRLAWLYLSEYNVEKTEVIIQDQLKKYVACFGAEDKYHVTLTVAAIRIVNHFISRSASDNFTDFIVEFPQLKTGFRELIASHYGFDIYASEKARLNYIEPDLLPF